MEQKIETQIRHRQEAYGVISALRSKLKQLEKKYDKVKEQNVGLKDCIKLYEQKFETIILHEAISLGANDVLRQSVERSIPQFDNSLAPAPH